MEVSQAHTQILFTKKLSHFGRQDLIPYYPFQLSGTDEDNLVRESSKNVCRFFLSDFR